MTADVKALVDQIFLKVQSAYAHAERPRYAAEDNKDALALLRELRPALTAQAEEIERLTAENERIWRERNIAMTKVKGWEESLVVEQLPLRALQVREWGPGEHEQVSIPQITPRRLTEILDELAALKAAQEVKA